MSQRYEILYKHNEFLQEYIGRDMKVLNTSGKELSNSSTMRDITRRILKEHWKHADVPVSPAKVVIWSNDKEGYIKQISASHLIWDKKEKIVFSDLINQNFGALIAALVGAYSTATKTASMTATDGTVNTLNILPNVAAGWFNTTALNAGLQLLVGKGTQGGNLRTVSNILTAFTAGPEAGIFNINTASAFNPTTGIMANGSSFAAGEVGTITEIASLMNLLNNLSVAKNYVFTYDIVNFAIAIAQMVQVAIVIQW